MSPTNGKYGVLEMSFEADSTGRSILRQLHREVPIIVQQALYFDEQLPLLPCVYILSSGGPHLDGDRYRIAIEVGERAMAHISTGAATIIAPMEQGRAERRASITLDEEAYLEWLPQALIPTTDSRYAAYTEFTIAPSATLFYSEVVACGRLHRGERFTYTELELCEVVCRPTGEVIARGGVRISPSENSPEGWAFMGSYTHFGSIMVVTPKEVTATLRTLLTPVMERDLRISVAELRDGCGFSLRLLGNSSEQLLGEIRRVCSLLRQEVKGVPLPPEFPWR